MYLIFSVIVMVIVILAMFTFYFCPKLRDKHCREHYDYNKEDHLLKSKSAHYTSSFYSLDCHRNCLDDVTSCIFIACFFFYLIIVVFSQNNIWSKDRCINMKMLLQKLFHSNTIVRPILFMMITVRHTMCK